MDNNILLETLKGIQKAVHNDYINQGGCIHYAYFLSKELSLRGIKHNVIALGHSIEELDYLVIKKVGCRHVMVHIPELNMYFDATDSQESTGYYASRILLNNDLKAINSLRLRHDAWNTLYDRRYNSSLKRVISNRFKKYDNTGS